MAFEILLFKEHNLEIAAFFIKGISSILCDITIIIINAYVSNKITNVSNSKIQMFQIIEEEEKRRIFSYHRLFDFSSIIPRIYFEGNFFNRICWFFDCSRYCYGNRRVHVGDINIAVSDGWLPFVQRDEILDDIKHE